MNSQLKDALNEFITSNSSAIEQAMHNGNHGKDEPVIQDLVNYLSCPTPQHCSHEDSQALPADDKILTHKPNFNSCNLEPAHRTHNNCRELQDGSQYSTGQMCVTANTANYTLGTPGQQCQPNSYEQNMYQESFKQNSCTNNDFHLGNGSTRDSSRDQENNGNQSSLKVVLSENHYFHSGQSVEFQCLSDVGRVYQHTLENRLNQFPGTENDVGHFQNNAPTNTSDFKNISQLATSLTPSADTPQGHYSPSQDSLGYGLMDVVQASVTNLETTASKFKAQEKMHVDEPEVMFNQANDTTCSSQLDDVLAGFVEAHMQSYSSDCFSTNSSQAANAASISCDSTSHSAPSSTIHSSSPFDLSRSSYQQSPLPSPFISHNFQQSPALPMPSPAESLSSSSDIQSQPGPCPGSSASSSSTDYVSSWQPANFSMSTSSSPYQDSQYQDCPVANHTPASISDSFPDSFQISSTASQAQGFNQEHQRLTFDSSLYQHPQSSHQPPLVDEFQQSSLVSSDYCSDATTVQSPHQHTGGFVSSVSTSINVSAPFSRSLPTGDLCQQHGYLASPVSQSSSHTNEPSDLTGYPSTGRATLTADITSANQTCVSQSMTDYLGSSSSDHVQVLTDSSKVPSDVTMGEFQSREKSETFSQLAFNVETSTSTSPQSASCLNTVSDSSGYDGYKYSNMSASFSQPTSADANTKFGFNQQSQRMTDVNPYNPALAMTSFEPGVCDQSPTHQLGSSTFSLHPASQTTNESYPQPMQVQESDFANKMAEFESSARNTETAMEISSTLMEKRDNLSSCISFEEIHMSIIKAGNALSNDLHKTSVHPHGLSDKPHSLPGQTEASANFPGMHSGQTNDIYQTEISRTNSVIYNIPNNTMAEVSSSLAHPDSLSSSVAATYTSNNSGSALSTFSTDHRLISSILNNLQMPDAPSSHLGLREQLDKQANITVPNFLENPRTLACGRTSDDGNFLSPADMSQAQLQTQSEVSSASTVSSGTVDASTGINQPILVAVSATSSQHATLNSGVSSSTESPQVNTSPWHSNTSFLNQPGLGFADHTSMSFSGQAVPSLSPKQAEGLATDSVSLSEVFPPFSETMSSALPHAANAATVNVLQGPKPSVTSLTVSAENLSSPLTSLSSEQPQIVVSLEDLQKLLAQQNLSHSSPSLHQQQSHAATLSPQTLVLQKHASHLRQSQPRLVIKGASLPNSSRVIHPHQQGQQARDRLLQLMPHWTSQQVSTGTVFPLNPDREVSCTSQTEIPQKFAHLFQLSNRDEHETQHKLLQQSQAIEQQSQPKLQLKQTQFLQQQQHTGNLSSHQHLSRCTHQKDTSSHPFDHHQTDQEHTRNELHPQNAQQSVHMQPDHQQQTKLQEQDEHQQQTKLQEQDEHQAKQFCGQVVQPVERPDISSTGSLRREYKHLHNLLTADSTGLSSLDASTHFKALPAVLNLSCGPQGQSSLQLVNRLSANPTNVNRVCPLLSAAPLSFLPISSFPTQNGSSNMEQPSAPLTPLAFVKTSTTCTFSKSFDTSQGKTETVSSNSQPYLLHAQNSLKLEDSSDKTDPDSAGDGVSNRHTSILAQILTERKRCHTPLSVDLNSPTNSSSEAASPLSSPSTFEDGSTQLTLIERSAGLHIRSDTMHSLNDDDDENAVFDINSFHKRPSTIEFHSAREQKGSVPIKIAKPSVHADAHTSVTTSISTEPKFDFGSAVTTTSHFFHFGKKEENSSEVYTFGTAASTCDSLQYKDGSKHYRPSFCKPPAKAVGLGSVVRATSHKMKSYSLKACYPCKVDSIELKIVEQPEPQHRARYQTEGSRGAIKDASQQGFPIIKLLGYNRATKLQVFIGDECSRVKPHGFYQACRVFGKSSTPCIEQEIEGTTLVEIEMLPENDMTVKLDCIGILKLRNADVERRIGPKRARDKKKTNIRARLVMRCVVEKCDGSQYLLQVVSNPIVCTQPVGQPEISRMSLSECSVAGGESLFIIGKNFRNKGTSVLFQKLDLNNDSLLWQAEAEVEQEFFQPTHLICKVPPYKDQTIESPLMAQVVISCAGKNSDPLCFLYKPDCHMAPSMKKEIRREADMAVSTRPMAFVSPEALHLNRMVEQSQVQSFTTASSMFQLPPGTIAGLHTATIKPCMATGLHTATIKPCMATGLDTATIKPCMATGIHTDPTPTQTALSSLSITAVSSSALTPASRTGRGQVLPTFLLEEKQDGLVQKIAQSNSKTNAVSSMSYDASEIRSQASPSSLSPGCEHTSCTDTPTCVSKAFPSMPFFVVVDPAALPTSDGGDKIQQLLRQILEAQSKI